MSQLKADRARRAVLLHYPAITLGLALLVLVVMQGRAAMRLSPLWQAWSDQSRYLQSAQAWATLNLDPALHHYPPGYSLLAAPFVYLMPALPFVVPDLL